MDKIYTQKLGIPFLNQLRHFAKKQSVLILCFFFLSAPILNAQIYINEFMASNSSTILDGADYDDWVELYNAGNSPVNIGGMYLSDDLTELTQSQIPTNNPSVTTIPAGGFIIIWFDKEPEQGPLHVDAKLGSGGEDIVLVAADGTTILDSYTFGPQASDISEGRTPDGSSSWDLYGEPTPGATNDTDPGAPIAEAPVPSVIGGVFSSAVSLNFSSATSGADIYYTLDGSEPTTSSTLYTGTINLSSTATIRARSFAPPLLPSPIVSQNYLFNVSHTFPIIAISVDPTDFNNMYTNIGEDIEIKANVELYEPNGDQAFSQLLEMELNGSGSLNLPQKSLGVKAKSSLGSNVIDYPIYDDLPYSEYRSLIFRSSGQDWNVTMFRDAMATGLIRNVGDLGGIIKKPKLYTQGYRPGVLYRNGEYFGIHNIRERTDKRYLKVHFDLDDNEVDFLENFTEVKEGDELEWDDFYSFIENNSFTNDANFDLLKERIDLEHYTDYIVFNLYTDNVDWPSNNDKRWRERVSDGKWRWLTFDLDFSFGLFTLNGPWNTGNWQQNSLQRLLQPNGFNWPNSITATRIFRKMIQNETWRHDLINKMADQLNVLYSSSRVVGQIDDLETLYQPEIQAHKDKWSGGFFDWAENVDKLRLFANNRVPTVRNHFVQAFSEVSGTGNVTVNASPSNGGTIFYSTLTLEEANLPFTGVYFRGIDIPVRAKADRGFVFNNWSGASNSSNEESSINISGNASLTANFSQGSTSSSPIVINEINYNSPDDPDSGDWVELYNPNNFSVNISGWYFEDESGDYFGLPANTILQPGAYLVLVEDEANFTSVFPNVNNYVGEFGKDPGGFGLSGGGERITLKNANGVLIDEVDYDDKSPWAEEADGDGPTLQLINPSLNNALAASWIAIPATPGAVNGSNSGPQDQTISFSSISDKSTTAPPFSINASASSGLPVSFSVISGPATVAGNTVTLTGGTGTVTIRASQGGNANYNPAPNVTRSFNVTNNPGPQDQTISFSSISNKTTTTPPFSINASASSGLPVSFSIVSGPATVSGNTVTLTGATGTVTVRASQGGNANYNPAPNVTRSFNVTQGQTGCDCTILDLTPDMITDLSNNSNTYVVNRAGSLVDEQNISGDPLCATGSTAPNDEWTLPWGAQSAYIDLGAQYDISKIALLDGSGVGEFNVYTGSPGNWGSQVINYNTVGYIKWAKFEDLNITTQYLRFDKTSSDAKIIEIRICASGNNSGPEDQTISFPSIPNQTNTNGPFQLNASASSGLPVSYEVLSGPATVSGNTISLTGGLGTVTISASQAGNTNYNPAPTVTRSFNVTTGQGPTDYCDASGVFPWHEWISSVNLANLNHSSSKSMYSDFTDQSADLIAGNTYTLSLTTGFSYQTWDEYWKVWIDYNQNNVFEEPQELAFAGVLPKPANGTPSASITDFITIPASASPGSTRMRVAMQREAYADPCGDFPAGEVEDYTINIGDVDQRLSEDIMGPLSLYPNPAEQNVFLDFEIKETAIVKTIIANAQGIELSHTDVSVQKGPNQLELDINELPAGYYIIYLKVEGFAPKSKRFLKIRD